MLHLARPLQDEALQCQHERALRARAEDDPETFDAAWGRDRIFVSIAAFRDPECQKTVAGLFARAERPERVTVGLVRQWDPVDDAAHLTGPDLPSGRVRELRFDWRESRGVCWARFLAQSLWRGEAHVLQIDAHMLFEDGWDAKLLADLRNCPGERSVLSFGSPPYLSPGDVVTDLHPALLRTDGFLGDGSIRFSGVWPPEPIEGQFRMPFLLAGGLFGPGEMIRDVPYDPHQCFALEEASYAARLFTHGFNVYSARTRAMWHQYRQNNTIRRKADHDAEHEARLLNYTRRGYVRFDHMTKHGRSTHPGDIQDLDLFGLGRARSLASYEDFAGLDFRAKRASEHALRARYIPDIHEVVKFSVPCLDANPQGPQNLMGEVERRLRITLRDWSVDRLAGELVELMLSIARSDLADVFQMRRGAEIFARRSALLADFAAWEHGALVSELARMVAAVSDINAAQDESRATLPLARIA